MVLFEHTLALNLNSVNMLLLSAALNNRYQVPMNQVLIHVFQSYFLKLLKFELLSCHRAQYGGVGGLPQYAVNEHVSIGGTSERRSVLQHTSNTSKCAGSYLVYDE